MWVQFLSDPWFSTMEEGTFLDSLSVFTVYLLGLLVTVRQVK